MKITKLVERKEVDDGTVVFRVVLISRVCFRPQRLQLMIIRCCCHGHCHLYPPKLRLQLYLPCLPELQLTIVMMKKYQLCVMEPAKKEATIERLPLSLHWSLLRWRWLRLLKRCDLQPLRRTFVNVYVKLKV